MFIGRNKEFQLFNDLYKRQDSCLAIVYGRRRVGKTEFIRRFCESKPHLYYACAECTDDVQLREFSALALSSGIPASKYVQSFSGWEQAIESALELPGDGKKILVIDEFPYAAKANGALPSLLQRLWDTVLKEKNVMLILCGSSIAFMEKELLSEKNPLYGRASAILKMRELPFSEAIQFFPAYSPEEKITAYAILGGMPYYLEQFDPKWDIRRNMERFILRRGTVLYNEVEFAMRQELREPATYNTIIMAVAMGATKASEIASKTNLANEKVYVYLRQLEELGIVVREFPVCSSSSEQANRQRGLYRLTDNYFRFWYAFVFPYRSALEADDAETILSEIISPKLNEFVSHSFEDICIDFMMRQKAIGTLPFIFTKIGRWWNKTDELDFLALNADGTAFIAGECKFKKSPLNTHEMRKTFGKFEPKKKDAAFYYYFFSKSGFTDDVQKYAEVDSTVRLVDLNEIVS